MLFTDDRKLRNFVLKLTSQGILRCHAMTVLMRHLKQKGHKVECERCHCVGESMTMSFFDTKMICPQCDNVEQRHPLYAEAKQAELKAVNGGDFNFPGVGLPSNWDKFESSQRKHYVPG